MKKSVKVEKKISESKGNKVLRNFIIIGVVVLILLFIFAMYSGKKEIEKEDELASIWDIGVLSTIGNFFGFGGDEVVSEADSGFQEGAPTIAETSECTADKDCKVCVQTCINNKCKDNGKILCDVGTPGDGKCVTNSQECKCKEKCDPCLEVCNGISGNCEKRKGWYKCPTGECVVSPDLCPKCNPSCKICEKCVQKQDPSGRDYYDCTPDWDLKDCGDGICVQPKEPCPQDCKPECTPCIQKCTSNGCEDTEMIWCSQDQSCRPKGFDCNVIKTPPSFGSTECQPVSIVRSDIEWDGSGDIATFCRNRGLEPGTTITYRTPSGSTTPVSCPCPI